jgi:hypothetical protein
MRGLVASHNGRMDKTFGYFFLYQINATWIKTFGYFFLLQNPNCNK